MVSHSFPPPLIKSKWNGEELHKNNIKFLKASKVVASISYHGKCKSLFFLSPTKNESTTIQKNITEFLKVLEVQSSKYAFQNCYNRLASSFL